MGPLPYKMPIRGNVDMKAKGIVKRIEECVIRTSRRELKQVFGG